MIGDSFEIPEYILEQQEDEKKFIKSIGKTMGYGRIMQLGQECWREALEKEGYVGGEFQCGPCVALTVPCGCSGSCDWCCGSGWLTKHVKSIKDKTE